MSPSEFLRGLGLDRYDLFARLRPALLVALPPALIALYWVKGVPGTLTATLSACGVTYLMAQVARRRGRAVEERLGDRAGRRHSARILTHADTTIAGETKARYHAFLVARGLRMSTPEEEQADRAVAYDRARSAVDWLLVYTRPLAKQSQLLEENIAYGFYRNLLGLKPIALVTLVMTLAVHVAFSLTQPVVDRASLTEPLLLVLILLGLIAAWIFIICDKAVVDASLAYAIKLFSQCETVEPMKAARKSSPRISQL